MTEMIVMVRNRYQIDSVIKIVTDFWFYKVRNLFKMFEIS